MQNHHSWLPNGYLSHREEAMAAVESAAVSIAAAIHTRKTLAYREAFMSLSWQLGPSSQ
jgi:hypothetical protein